MREYKVKQVNKTQKVNIVYLLLRLLWITFYHYDLKVLFRLYKSFFFWTLIIQELLNIIYNDDD